MITAPTGNASQGMKSRGFKKVGKTIEMAVEVKVTAVEVKEPGPLAFEM